ncbi:MAG: hypothetical protein Q8T08_13770 [Ignavibacteria bacterium]|nr:hypothetical protein [Ignavibacteria bacterium]
MRTRTQFIVVLIVIFLISCTQKKKNEFYIYDKDKVFKIDTSESMVTFSTSKPIFTSWDDSTKFEISRKGYFLMHYLSIGGSNLKGTIFIKHKSFLDSIDYFDSSWLKDEDNLDWFWSNSKYKGGFPDSAKIFIIEPKQRTDSLIIRQVHRFFNPGMEG